MTHLEMDELYELYVLGALEIEVASEIDGHVAENCPHCLNQIHRAVNTTAELSVMADPVTPPAEVRSRLLASVGRPPVAGRPRFFSWAVPLLAAACVVLLLLFVYSARAIDSATSRLVRVTYERDQLRSAVEILSRRETRTIQFSNKTDPAHGTVLVNKDGGVVLVGSELPALATDKIYELWAIPAKGNPIPAGLFRSNSSGNFVHVAPQPVDIAQLAAVAVTVEPEAGSSAPTSKPIIVVPVT